MTSPGSRAKGLFGGIVNVAILAAIIFVSSGRLDWPMAWALLAVHLAGISLATLAANPGLIEERSRRKADAGRWDSAVVAAMSIAGLAALALAGLDVRFGWSGAFPPSVEAAGLALLIVGFAIVDWATIANPFFSTVYRIQSDRGHAVVSGGPYGLVRHPGYAGLLVCIFAQPLLLGSAWALLPAGLTAAILVVRTGIEDKKLMADLPGYREYATKVRYRLVPGAW